MGDLKVVGEGDKLPAGDGRFVVIDNGPPLGAGSIGIAWGAKLQPSGLSVVVKVLRPERAVTDQTRKHFHDEAQILSDLHLEGARVPECIFKSLDAHDGLPPYVVIGRADGDTLSRISTSQRVSEPVAIALGVAFLTTLEIAHLQHVAYLDWSLRDLYWNTTKCSLGSDEPTLKKIASGDALIAIDWNASARSTGDSLSKDLVNADLRRFGQQWYELLTGLPFPTDINSVDRFCRHDLLGESSLWVRLFIARCVGIGGRTHYPDAGEALMDLSGALDAWTCELTELQAEAAKATEATDVLRVHSIGRVRRLSSDTADNTADSPFEEQRIFDAALTDWKYLLFDTLDLAKGESTSDDWLKEANGCLHESSAYLEQAISAAHNDAKIHQAVHHLLKKFMHGATRVKLPQVQGLARALDGVVRGVLDRVRPSGTVVPDCTVHSDAASDFQWVKRLVEAWHGIRATYWGIETGDWSSVQVTAKGASSAYSEVVALNGNDRFNELTSSALLRVPPGNDTVTDVVEWLDLAQKRSALHTGLIADLQRECDSGPGSDAESWRRRVEELRAIVLENGDATRADRLRALDIVYRALQAHGERAREDDSKTLESIRNQNRQSQLDHLRRELRTAVESIEALRGWLNEPATAMDAKQFGTHVQAVQAVLVTERVESPGWGDESSAMRDALLKFAERSPACHPTRWGVVIGWLQDAVSSGAITADHGAPIFEGFRARLVRLTEEAERLLPVSAQEHVRPYATVTEVASSLMSASKALRELQLAHAAVVDKRESKRSGIPSEIEKEATRRADDVAKRIDKYVEALERIASRQRELRGEFDRAGQDPRAQLPVLNAAVDEKVQFYDEPSQSPEDLLAIIGPLVQGGLSFGFDPEVMRAQGLVARLIRPALLKRPHDPEKLEKPSEPFDRAIASLGPLVNDQAKAVREAAEVAHGMLAEGPRRDSDLASLSAMEDRTVAMDAAGSDARFEKWTELRDDVRRFVATSWHLSWHATVESARSTLWNLGTLHAVAWAEAELMRSDPSASSKWFGALLGSLEALALATSDESASARKLEGLRTRWAELQAPREKVLDEYKKLEEQVIGAKSYWAVKQLLFASTVDRLKNELANFGHEKLKDDLANQQRVAFMLNRESEGQHRRSVPEAKKFYIALNTFNETQKTDKVRLLAEACDDFVKYYSKDRDCDAEKLWVVRLARRLSKN